MDVDFDGDITNLDVIMMQSVNFDYLMFLTGPPIVTLPSVKVVAACNAIIRAQFVRANDVPITSSLWGVVFLDLESSQFGAHPSKL